MMQRPLDRASRRIEKGRLKRDMDRDFGHTKNLSRGLTTDSVALSVCHSAEGVVKNAPSDCLRGKRVIPVTLGDVSATASVGVWKPYFATKNLQLGTVTDSFAMGHGTIASGGESSGFSLYGAVGTPAFFVAQGKGTGMWSFAQLCKLYRDTDPWRVGTKMADYQLDSAFPYNPTAGVGDVPGAWNVADSTADKSRFYPFDDTPTTSYTIYDAGVTVHDNFRLYMMYQPPDAGNGTQYVPLLEELWGWDVSVQRKADNSWTLPLGKVHYDGEIINPPYPEWNDVFLSGPELQRLQVISGEDHASFFELLLKSFQNFQN